MFAGGWLVGCHELPYFAFSSFICTQPNLKQQTCREKKWLFDLKLVKPTSRTDLKMTDFENGFSSFLGQELSQSHSQ